MPEDSIENYSPSFSSESEDKRCAIVTGGGSGIGAATARRLARDGYFVCVVGRRLENLQRVAEEIDGLAICGDVSGTEGPQAVIEQCIEKFARIDALVINAGISEPGRPHDVSESSWDRVISTNLTGAMFTCRAALPKIMESNGTIVTVGSVSSLRAAPGAIAYNAAKAGLKMVTECIALEYGQFGVRANHVCPGWTRTDMADLTMDGLGMEYGVARNEAYRIATESIPARRAGTPEEVANVIAWLASSEASYVNGATITVDGGGLCVDSHFAAFKN